MAANSGARLVMNGAFAQLLVLLLATCPASLVGAEVTPFTVWTAQARQELPLWVQCWIYFMFLMAGLGLFFVRKHPEARWALGAFVVSHLLSGLETLIFGADHFKVGMIAINHAVVWTPAAWIVGRSLRKANLRSPFGVWLVGICGMFVFSLIFDFRDAGIYLFAPRPG